MFVPGCLLKLIECVVRSSINSNDKPLKIILSETDECLKIEYHHNDSIDGAFSLKDLEAIEQVYSIYTLNRIILEENEQTRIISIPKLHIKS